MSRLFVVDCEAYGPCPSMGRLTWFGAVEYTSEQTFDGLIVPSRARRDNPAIPEEVDPATDEEYFQKLLQVFTRFDDWLGGFGPLHTFVSDNPAFDWQWINDAFHRTLRRNPFGFSARRIGDFYAGLKSDFRQTQDWKKLRVTKHDHNPVNDALGNVQALKRLIAGERPSLSRRYK